MIQNVRLPQIEGKRGRLIEGWVGLSNAENDFFKPIKNTVDLDHKNFHIKELNFLFIVRMLDKSNLDHTLIQLVKNLAQILNT